MSKGSSSQQRWILIAAVLGSGAVFLEGSVVLVASLGEKRAGIASGVNNASARVAGLLATASIPVAAGLGGSHEASGAALSSAFTRAMLISAALCGVGALAAFVMIPGKRSSR